MTRWYCCLSRSAPGLIGLFCRFLFGELLALSDPPQSPFFALYATTQTPSLLNTGPSTTEFHTPLLESETIRIVLCALQNSRESGGTRREPWSRVDAMSHIPHRLIGGQALAAATRAPSLAVSARMTLNDSLCSP